MTELHPPTNVEIAARLEDVAALLDAQHANAFRVSAYRHAAEVLRGLPRPVHEIVAHEGLNGLKQLPGIGESLARSIRTLVRTGHLPILDRLRGESDPEAVLQTVPGIGPVIAARLHDQLGIDSLEALELAAYDGRLQQLGKIGEKRLKGIRDVLARRLGQVQRRRVAADTVPVSDLLDVDAEYRQRAQGSGLRRIAPRRFNPAGEAWLPVLHTRRGLVDYTALYSNTARAHEQGMTRDWVVIYHDDGRSERVSTVLTAQRGDLAGRRLVVGREKECRTYYGALDRASGRDAGAVAPAPVAPPRPPTPRSTRPRPAAQRSTGR